MQLRYLSFCLFIQRLARTPHVCLKLQFPHNLTKNYNISPRAPKGIFRKLKVVTVWGLWHYRNYGLNLSKNQNLFTIGFELSSCQKVHIFTADLPGSILFCNGLNKLWNDVKNKDFSFNFQAKIYIVLSVFDLYFFLTLSIM